MSLQSQVTLLATAIGTEIKSVRTWAVTWAAQPAGSTITLTKVAGVWPGVPTTRTDIVIIWSGADPSPTAVASRTLGVAGFLTNVDLRVI